MTNDIETERNVSGSSRLPFAGRLGGWRSLVARFRFGSERSPVQNMGTPDGEGPARRALGISNASPTAVVPERASDARTHYSCGRCTDRDVQEVLEVVTPGPSDEEGGDIGESQAELEPEGPATIGATRGTVKES